MFGHFSESSLESYAELVKEKVKKVKKVAGTEWADSAGISEHDSSFIDTGESYEKEDYAECYDFTTCLRNDGSRYGTAGKCRKGTQTEQAGKEERESRLRETYGKAYLTLERLKQRRKKFKSGKKAAELDSRIEKLGKVLLSVDKEHMKLREENAKSRKTENFGKLPNWATEGRSLA
jgi:hypothetical protein